MRKQSSRKLPNWVIGVVMLVVLAVASYVAFTKQVPWGGGTEVTAVFNSAQNLRANSPVRIAGVEVGKVTKVEPLAGSEAEGIEDEAAAGSVQTGAVVTMELDDAGLPLKEDATFTLKPRLFLEGNLFVDVRPGSPSSPTVDYADYVYPATRTSNTVQLDEVLTGALEADAREDLQILLDQFGTALVDEGGAESLRTLNRVSPGAFLYTSQVNEAILGENPHDLSELIANLDRVVRGLGANEAELQDLVTNLRITTGSFAAQSAPLERALIELPDTLDAGNAAFASLNTAFPPLRAFAREALPGRRDDARDARRRHAAAAPAARPGAAGGAARPRRRPAADGPEAGEADPLDDPVPEAGPGAVELLQQRRAAVGQRRGRRRPRVQRPARPEREDLRGDRLRARRDRRREPLRRRQRPVHPRDRRRRQQHGRARRPVHRRDARRRHPLRDRRRDAAARRLGEDPVRRRRAVRDPGPA